MTKLQREFQEEIQAAILKLKEKYRPEKIILYGSAARGDFNDDSDIDLLIIKKGVGNQKPHRRIFEVLMALDNLSRIEPRVYDPEEISSRKTNNFFLNDALKKGRIIYQNETE